MTNGNPVSKNDLFNSIVSEAQGFHNQILTIASIFLGGTLIFLEKIVSNPSPCSLIWLFLGWLSLLISIGLSGLIRLNNLKAGRLALENKWSDAQELDRKKELWSALSLIMLVIGITLVTIFGAINIFEKKMNNEEKVMSEEKPLNSEVPKIANKKIGKGSIPYGSAGPQPPAESSSLQESTNNQALNKPEPSKTETTEDNNSDSSGKK